MTGQSLDALARREVFEPLGMARSGFVWQRSFDGDAAYAKDWLWRVAPANRYADANAAASLLTTAPDYARFVAAVLAGRGLRPEHLGQAFLTPVHQTGPGISMALGIRVERGPAGPIFYHSGNNGRRFTCYMSGDVARQAGMVYFTNTYNGTSLMAALASRVYGEAPRHRDDFDRYDDPRLARDPLGEARRGRAGCRRGAGADGGDHGRQRDPPVIRQRARAGRVLRGPGARSRWRSRWCARRGRLAELRRRPARPGQGFGSRGAAGARAGLVPPGDDAGRGQRGDGRAVRWAEDRGWLGGGRRASGRRRWRGTPADIWSGG